jgi:guanylate kinase
MIKENKFIEYNCFNNNYYGTSKSELSRLSEKMTVFKILKLDLHFGN